MAPPLENAMGSSRIAARRSPVFVDQRRGRYRIVEREDERIGQGADWEPGRVQDADRSLDRSVGPSRRRGDHHRVVGPVIEALAFCDHGSTGHRTGHANGTPHGLRTGVDESDPGELREVRAEPLDVVDLRRGGREVLQQATRLFDDGRGDLGIRIAVEVRTAAHDEVDVVVAIDVAHPTAGG